MGTSKSGSGPGDRRPLLPKWAFDPLDPVPVEPIPPVETPPVPIELPPPTISMPPAIVPPPVPSVILPTKAPAPWRSVHTRMGKVVTGGGRGAMGGAASGWVRAQGGSRRAASSARSGRTATAGLGGFLADVSKRGFADAAKEIGLSKVVGLDPESLLGAVCDAIAPDGATPQDGATRSAIFDSLLPLYERLIQAAASPDT